MAFSTGGSSGGLRGRRSLGGSNGALSEINIVPLVDVVLVLLIIFMLTAHVMDYGIQVDVPKVKVTNQSNDVLPTIFITKRSEAPVERKAGQYHDLPAQLEKRFKGQKIVFVAADKAVRLGHRGPGVVGAFGGETDAAHGHEAFGFAR